jgi:hypothetical protein
MLAAAEEALETMVSMPGPVTTSAVELRLGGTAFTARDTFAFPEGNPGM